MHPQQQAKSFQTFLVSVKSVNKAAFFLSYCVHLTGVFSGPFFWWGLYLTASSCYIFYKYNQLPTFAFISFEVVDIPTHPTFSSKLAILHKLLKSHPLSAIYIQNDCEIFVAATTSKSQLEWQHCGDFFLSRAQEDVWMRLSYICAWRHVITNHDASNLFTFECNMYTCDSYLHSLHFQAHIIYVKWFKHLFRALACLGIPALWWSKSTWSISNVAWFIYVAHEGLD